MEELFIPPISKSRKPKAKSRVKPAFKNKLRKNSCFWKSTLQKQPLWLGFWLLGPKAKAKSPTKRTLYSTNRSLVVKPLIFWIGLTLFQPFQSLRLALDFSTFDDPNCKISSKNRLLALDKYELILLPYNNLIWICMIHLQGG